MAESITIQSNAINIGQNQLKEENEKKEKIRGKKFCTTLIALLMMTTELVLSKRVVLRIAVIYFLNA